MKNDLESIIKQLPEDLHYILDEVKLESPEPAHQARRFGIFAAMPDVMKLHYHKRDPKVVSMRKTVVRMQQSPPQFVNKAQRDVAAWVDKFQRDGWRWIDPIVAVYQECLVSLGDWLDGHSRLSHKERAQVNVGYGIGKKWAARFTYRPKEASGAKTNGAAAGATTAVTA